MVGHHPNDQMTLNAHVIALYVTDAHTRRTLTDDEFNRLVAQGAAAIGDDLTDLARDLAGLESAWATGHLPDDTYHRLISLRWPDPDRLERCYGHAIGEPYP